MNVTASSSARGPDANDRAITEAVVDFLEGHGVTTYAFARSPSAIVVSLPNEPDRAVERHIKGIRARLRGLSLGPPSPEAGLVARDPRDDHAIIIAIKSPPGESDLRDEIVRVLKAEEPELRRRGIESLRLFGSVSRRKSHPNDVDLLARFRPGLRLSAFDIADTQAYIEQRLGRRVDLSNEQTFPSAFKIAVERTGVPIFGT
jgi:predicted nucleotidyltransferase